MRRIAFFLPSLAGGGAERVAINLLKGMSAQDIPLDLVLAAAEGPYLNQVPPQVRIVNLAAGRVLKAIVPLSRYLRQNRPLALLSHMNYANVAAAIAKNLAQTKTRLVFVEQNTPSAGKTELFRARFVIPLMKFIYPHADAVIAVSKGVAEDLARLGIGKENLNVVYSPIVDDELFARGKAQIDHPWFQVDSPPVFLAVGRLTAQKDFLNLIEAFAILRKQIIARLLILGEGKCRAELEARIDGLGINQDVLMPGFVENPYAYMSRASAFVLSSRWEGLPTVLIEAIACGCPVISTDCPSGPTEILAGGIYGPLVPVGNAQALSEAMLQVLDNPVSRDVLIQRAMDFSIERAVPEYLALLGY